MPTFLVLLTAFCIVGPDTHITQTPIGTVNLYPNENGFGTVEINLPGGKKKFEVPLQVDIETTDHFVLPQRPISSLFPELGMIPEIRIPFQKKQLAENTVDFEKFESPIFDAFPLAGFSNIEEAKGALTEEELVEVIRTEAHKRRNEWLSAFTKLCGENDEPTGFSITVTNEAGGLFMSSTCFIVDVESQSIWVSRN